MCNNNQWSGDSCLWIVLILILFCCCGSWGCGNSCGNSCGNGGWCGCGNPCCNNGWGCGNGCSCGEHDHCC